MEHVLARHLLGVVLGKVGRVALQEVVVEARVGLHQLLRVPPNLLRRCLGLVVPEGGGRNRCEYIYIRYVYIYMYIYICTYMYVCIYVCIYTYMYIYLYTHMYKIMKKHGV